MSDLQLARRLSKVPLENLEFINNGLKFEISLMSKKSSMLVGAIDKTGAIPLIIGLMFTINKILLIIEIDSEIIDYFVISFSAYTLQVYISLSLF